MKKIYDVIQEEKSDCGICCLESIIKYYNGYVPLETLRINTNTDYNGTNALELINCAKKYGFNAYGKKEKNINNIKSPVIVHLKLENELFHFVVLYKIDKNYVYVMDPATGKKRMSLDKFYKLYTGIMLFFEPINTIPKYKESKFINNKIKLELKNNKDKYIKILIITFILLLLSLIISLETKIISLNNKYIYLLIIVILICEILSYIKNIKVIDLCITFNNNIIKYFINHIFKLPLKYLKLKKKGEISTRFNELNELSFNVVSIYIELLFYIFINIIIIIMLFFITLKTSLILLVFTFIYIIINYKIYLKLINIIKYSINIEEDYNSNIIDYISNINTIKNLKSYDYFKNNILLNLKSKNSIKKDLNKKIYRINLINNLIINILMLIIINIIFKNNYNITNSLTIFILFNFYIENIKSLIKLIPTLLILKSIIFKNNDFLSYNENNKPKLTTKFKEIEIKGLSYKINNNMIIKNINYKIYDKDKIFVFGPSGIGKSTLMKILNQEIYEYSGSVFKDYINIKKYDLSNLITYVNQDASLFDDSIYNNITLGKKIDKKYLEKVLKICRLDKLINSKYSKLNSIIINNSNISGGEKNRIILARSLIYSKKILILDEVLKEVDINLEIEILKDLLKYYKNKTIIYISHKNVRSLFSKTLTLGKE